MTDEQVSGKLIDEKNTENDPISFSITAYEKGIFRIKMHEYQSSLVQKLEKRYEVKDVLQEGLKTTKISYNSGVLKNGLLLFSQQ